MNQTAAQEKSVLTAVVEARARELELGRARAVLEAVLTRAGMTAEWNGGPEQGTALIHVLPKLQRLERYERRAFSKRRRALRDL
jgi:type II secretory pathway component PulJ